MHQGDDHQGMVGLVFTFKAKQPGSSCIIVKMLKYAEAYAAEVHDYFGAAEAIILNCSISILTS